jgi:hypothetical protein
MKPFKTIRHEWLQTGFQKCECSKCHCVKLIVNGFTFFEKYVISVNDPGCEFMNEKPFKVN